MRNPPKTNSIANCGNQCVENCCQNENKSIDILEVVKGPSIGNVSTEGKWEKIEATVDSGAADTVGPNSIAEWMKPTETKASKAGLRYNAAEGSEIKNMGEKELNVVNDLGAAGKITVQIGDKINKLLAAVSKIGHAGNKITFFDDDGCHRIVNKASGVETKMHEVNGTFKMPLWVWNPKGCGKQSEATGFQGQGEF